MTRPPSHWLLLAPALVLSALAFCACGKRADSDEASSRGLKVEAYDAPIARAPRGDRLETLKPLPEDAAPLAASALPPAASDAAAQPEAEARPPLPVIRVAGPAIPPGREAGAAPYDPFAKGQAAPAQHPPETATPGFRITVPLCRQAERSGDPLARTAECQALLKAAEDQAKACRQAFEAGDDKSAMSPACRQAAGFR